MGNISTTIVNGSQKHAMEELNASFLTGKSTTCGGSPEITVKQGTVEVDVDLPPRFILPWAQKRAMEELNTSFLTGKSITCGGLPEITVKQGIVEVDVDLPHRFILPWEKSPIKSCKRLVIDLKGFQQDPPDGIIVSVQDNDFRVLNAVITGPGDSIWDGGKFKLILIYPIDYPLYPPKIRFVSRMFHPNIYADGSICLDFLQDSWNPALTVTKVLLSIQSLLCDPNPNSPANSEAARMFIEDRREYNLKVREIVEETLSDD